MSEIEKKSGKELGQLIKEFVEMDDEVRKSAIMLCF
jgi:hypothetical protein